MPLPTSTYPLALLESEINVLPNGKARKPRVDLSGCALKELVQYKCNVKPKEDGASPVIVCAPVVRWFRRCGNGMHVETTAWEGWKAAAKDDTQVASRNASAERRQRYKHGH